MVLTCEGTRQKRQWSGNQDLAYLEGNWCIVRVLEAEYLRDLLGKGACREVKTCALRSDLEKLTAKAKLRRVDLDRHVCDSNCWG